MFYFAPTMRATRHLRAGERIALLTFPVAFPASLAALGTFGVGACSAQNPAGYPSFDAGEDSGSVVIGGGDAGEDVVFQNGFGDDAGGAGIDAAPPASCPGASITAGSSSTQCSVDSTEGCPSCAPWGFACVAGASPELQSGSPSSFCRALQDDAGALICCTQPACIVSTIVGGCDGGAQKRYDCTGGAVPKGTCTWQGADSPNDYCCE